MTLLTKFWEDNEGLEYPEQWGTGNTYVSGPRNESQSCFIYS